MYVCRPCASTNFLGRNIAQVLDAKPVSETVHYYSLSYLPNSCGDSITTGSEILDRLAFGDDTVSYCIMGLSLLLIGYFIMAVFFLHRSKAHFMALGFDAAPFIFPISTKS